jgi:hypothetical protein
MFLLREGKKKRKGKNIKRKYIRVRRGDQRLMGIFYFMLSSSRAHLPTSPKSKN